MFEICKTLEIDLPLFAELGLSPFKTKRGEKKSVGKVQFGDGSYVKIWVIAAPAQFWQFEVYCAESDRIHKISTGSGSFSDYWKSIRMVAIGLLIVDETSERCN